MRPVDQVMNDLKDAEAKEAAARAVTVRFKEELNAIYIAVSEALGKKPTRAFGSVTDDCQN